MRINVLSLQSLLTNSANRLWTKNCWNKFGKELCSHFFWQVCACAGQHSARMAFKNKCAVCINPSPATKSQARWSEPDPWLCCAAATCWLPGHGSVHHAHQGFIPQVLNENNHTSFGKQFMLLTNTLHCFDLAARGVSPADHFLFRLQNLGQRPFSSLENQYRENAESPLFPGPSAAIVLFNAALMLFLLQPKEKWKLFWKKPHSGFGFDPDFSQSKSLDTGEGSGKFFHSHCRIRFAAPEEDTFSE